MHKRYTTYKGNKFYLIDDCETLLCKLKNIMHDCFMNSRFDKYVIFENDAKLLQEAISIKDVETMQNMINKYSQLFKRYKDIEFLNKINKEVI